MSTHTNDGRICAPEDAKLDIDSPSPDAHPLAHLADTDSVGP
jgi:hypothetical protein